MTEKHQIYKCNICGNIVEVLHTGVGELVCCGQLMELLVAKTDDVTDVAEKHLPVIEELPPSDCKMKDGVLIKIGEVEHPMEKDHHIEWIEIIVEDGKRGKRFLDLDDKPESKFYTRKKILGVRVYCNVHGLYSMNNVQ
ncbi:desulfoferrodoxin [bacterium]|nr:MAG: desulfoferrodoxin [bacterium]